MRTTMNDAINTEWMENSVEPRRELAEHVSEASLESAVVDAAVAAREAYLAYDEGALEEAPEALAAYLDYQMHLDV